MKETSDLGYLRLLLAVARARAVERTGSSRRARRIATEGVPGETPGTAGEDARAPMRIVRGVPEFPGGLWKGRGDGMMGGVENPRRHDRGQRSHLRAAAAR